MLGKFKFVTAAAIISLAVPIAGHAKSDVVIDVSEAASLETSAEPATSAPQGMEASMMALIAKIFAGDDKLPPIAPAQLTKAEKAVTKLLPDGTLAKMIGGMIQRIALPIIDMTSDMSNYKIMEKTGIYDGTVEKLDEKSRAEIAALLDPTRKQRGQMFLDAAMPLLNKAIGVMEVPMRNGLARAYARKFSVDQLNQLNAFFATPTGSFYATESYALQADPEIMKAVFQSFPLMIEQMKGSSKEMDIAVAKLPKERSLADLNDTEMAKLASLLGVSVDKLKEQRELSSAAAVAAADAANTAAEAAEGAATAVEDPTANESGEEPWYDKENWAKATKKKVDALDSAYNKASEKSSSSYAAWEDAHNKAVADTRERYQAEGWQPEAKAE